ncbi:uncharacterized protein LOC130699319 [Daphnia carinata]|uniref:uncharacterized protein LOC130699319 n=1 Tax=Daphnia carinata TaxID=120202 RepID=UPI00257EAC43|nr:uncharacterized protein LOC130699319 [Daphnia carinata]
MSTLFALVAVLLTVASSQAATETGSDIVTEILKVLKGHDELWRVADYLNSSRTALVNELPLETSGRKLSYTFFAPTAMAFLRQMPQDTVDPLIIDDGLRTKVLIRHFARQRVSANDLGKLDKLVMADSKEAILTRTPGTQVNVINKAEIQPGAIQLPDNIGTIYTVDRVFMTGEEVGQAISAHFERNPNTGFGFFG